MKNRLKPVLLQQEDFLFSLAPQYIGQLYKTIISIHTDYNLIPYCLEEEGIFILEIRLTKSTLSCIIKDNICIEAYQFTD